MHIEKDKVVSLSYTLRDEDGSVLDHSPEDKPLTYLHGYGNIIMGLEEALNGKREGDSLEITLPPEKAYGERNAGLIQKIGIDQFPNPDSVEIGMRFQAQIDQEVHILSVMGIEGDEVRVDANHPLAGETLQFEVDVVDVREATTEEIEHGHSHEGGGH